MTVTRTGRQQAGAALARSRVLTEPVLRAAVGTLPEALRVMAGYHLGWWDTTGTPTNAGSGKGLRPALVLAATVACGAAPPAGTQAAAAVELLHNFTLLHDDVMDADPTRRGRPIVWRIWGTANAILAGDALHALAMRVLADAPLTAVVPGIDRLAACVIELCQGQHEDCAFQSRPHVAVAECVRMAGHKTGALLGCCCALGAMCAGADAGVVAAMDRFGRELGLAFQLVDDVLGIWGDPAKTGKPAGADLAVRKVSLPVVAALSSGTAAGRELPDGLAAGELVELAELAVGRDR